MTSQPSTPKSSPSASTTSPAPPTSPGGVGIPFPVLYDPNGTVPKAYMVYGLIESNRAAPSTFILDKNGIITWKHIGNTISDRIGPYTIIHELEAIEG